MLLMYFGGAKLRCSAARPGAERGEGPLPGRSRVRLERRRAHHGDRGRAGGDLRANLAREGVARHWFGFPGWVAAEGAAGFWCLPHPTRLRTPWTVITRGRGGLPAPPPRAGAFTGCGLGRAQCDAGGPGLRPFAAAGALGPGPKTPLAGSGLAATAFSLVPAPLCIPHWGAPRSASQSGLVMSPGPRSAPPVQGLPCRSSSLLLLQLLLNLPLARGTCGVPERLPFAMMTKDSTGQENFPEGSKVNYTCRPGYLRNYNLPPTRTCLPNGTWSEATQFCQKKRCPNLGDLINGHINIEEDMVFGSTISFSCEKGFLLVGQPQTRCEIIGENQVGWSEPLPECQVIHCNPPPDVANGQFTGAFQDYFTYGSSVRYTCDKTYSLIGDESIHCTTNNMKDGEWSGSPPQCKVVRCESPVFPNGRLLSGRRPPYTYKEAVILECNSGFHMEGEEKISCGANNSWVPGVPQCIQDVKSTTASTTTTTTTTNTTTTTTTTTTTGSSPDSGKENQLDTIILVVTLIIFTLI
ncbi:complement decay-accelerating factor-like [Trichosurus vulpecula]|uniref:complement decay-accelerating factor-like n=1 Tax=Trichosurus vulpecula TaxID=9337 RepID=UPI00186B1456|nr:complement decay-accelerating factor-like [Trichosurus vulpecula]